MRTGKLCLYLAVACAGLAGTFTRNPEGYTDRMSEQSQQDLQRAEEARSFLVPRVQKFMDRARNADTATLTAQIYYFLQSLGAEEAMQKLTDGLRACGDLPNADEACGNGM